MSQFSEENEINFDKIYQDVANHFAGNGFIDNSTTVLYLNHLKTMDADETVKNKIKECLERIYDFNSSFEILLQEKLNTNNENTQVNEVNINTDSFQEVNTQNIVDTDTLNNSGLIVDAHEATSMVIDDASSSDPINDCENMGPILNTSSPSMIIDISSSENQELEENNDTRPSLIDNNDIVIYSNQNESSMIIEMFSSENQESEENNDARQSLIDSNDIIVHSSQTDMFVEPQGTKRDQLIENTDSEILPISKIQDSQINEGSPTALPKANSFTRVDLTSKHGMKMALLNLEFPLDNPFIVPEVVDDIIRKIAEITTKSDYINYVEIEDILIDVNYLKEKAKDLIYWNLSENKVDWMTINGDYERLMRALDGIENVLEDLKRSVEKMEEEMIERDFEDLVENCWKMHGLSQREIEELNLPDLAKETAKKLEVMAEEFRNITSEECSLEIANI